MSEILGRCGYRCDLCPAYVDNATDDAARQAASDGWFKYFGFRVPAAAIRCRGCSPECIDKNCPVRPCAEARGLANCGLCEEFPCSNLNTRMAFVDQFLADHPDLFIPPADFEKYFRPYQGTERLQAIRDEHVTRRQS
jgi:hypothetical protein